MLLKKTHSAWKISIGIQLVCNFSSSHSKHGSIFKERQKGIFPVP